MTLILSFDQRVVNNVNAACVLDSIISKLTDLKDLIDLFEINLFKRYWQEY